MTAPRPLSECRVCEFPITRCAHYGDVRVVMWEAQSCAVDAPTMPWVGGPTTAANPHVHARGPARAEVDFQRRVRLMLDGVRECDNTPFPNWCRDDDEVVSDRSR